MAITRCLSFSWPVKKKGPEALALPSRLFRDDLERLLEYSVQHGRRGLYM